ncbi:MAG: preprotein translocase subunit SecE [Ignavibacteria bacterium]|nr:preprotein translocase subunit SecE [Ignavibacteria bacterium]
MQLKETDMKEKIVAFVNDFTKELKKVTWPSKEELKESTMVVVVMCIILACFTYVIDMGISYIFKMIF